MTMQMKWILALTALALWAGAVVERARADESFVCADGRVVTVVAGNRAKLGKQSPCQVRAAKDEGRSLLPVRNPVRIAASATTATAKAEASQAPQLVHTASAPAPPGQSEKLATKGSSNPDAETSTPAARSSYRRVRVINARSEADRWFLHRR